MDSSQDIGDISKWIVKLSYLSGTCWLAQVIEVKNSNSV